MRSLAGYALALSIGTAAGVATPLLVARTIDAIVGHSPSPLPLLVAALTVAAAADVAATLLSARALAQATARLRRRCVAHLLAVHRPAVSTGDAIARVVTSTSAAAGMPVAIVSGSVGVLAALAGLAMLWYIDPVAGAVFTLAAPVAVLLARRFLTDVGRVQGGYVLVQAALAGRLVTALGGIRTIRAAGTVEAEVARVLAPLPELSAAGHALWAVQRRSIWRIGLVAAAVELLVLGAAGLGVAAGHVAAADLVAVVAYTGMALAGFDQIDTLLTLGQGRAGAARLDELLAGAPPIDGHRGLQPGPGAVRLRGVTLAGLTDIDLDVPGGTSLALVGPGASELAGLLGRRTDPERGEITLDGVPLPDIRLAELRAAVTFAYAEPVLVGATVGAAIGYGTDRPIEAAARDAGADAFISRLPQRYDTPLGQAPMSGGELQRVGLARALVRDARVLVVDDATVGLDAATEAAVRAGILRSERTRVVVARSAPTAAGCDLVAWLHEGRLRAVATHHDLLPDPAYRALFEETP